MLVVTITFGTTVIAIAWVAFWLLNLGVNAARAYMEFENEAYKREGNLIWFLAGGFLAIIFAALAIWHPDVTHLDIIPFLVWNAFLVLNIIVNACDVFRQSRRDNKLQKVLFTLLTLSFVAVMIICAITNFSR